MRTVGQHLVSPALIILILGTATVGLAQEPAADPLPSWNVSPTKTAILEFVARTTKAGGPHFVPPAERVSVSDNDGTLWCEQPLYVQLAFAIDRVRNLAPEHPEWNGKQPFQAPSTATLTQSRASARRACWNSSWPRTRGSRPRNSSTS